MFDTSNFFYLTQTTLRKLNRYMPVGVHHLNVRFFDNRTVRNGRYRWPYNLWQYWHPFVLWKFKKTHINVKQVSYALLHDSIAVNFCVRDFRDLHFP